MNEELDELVYAMEDLNLSEQKIRVLMNKGDTGGPQDKFEIGGGSKSMKEEIDTTSVVLPSAMNSYFTLTTLVFGYFLIVPP